MIPFNYHHLYYFYTAARHLSISKAAGELRISQPALSTQIKQLELFLNTQLFERENRKLALTEEGHIAFSYAQSIFDLGREFLDGMLDRSQMGRTRIQIGVTNSTGKAFANALVQFVLNDSPSAHILLHEDSLANMIQNLKDHKLDILLSDTPHQTSQEEAIQNQLAGRLPVVFCAHPKIAKKIKNFPADFEKSPLILPTTQSGVYQALQEYFTTEKLNPNILSEVQDVELIHRMALDGLGIAPLDKYSVSHSPFKEKLNVLPFGPKQGIHLNIYLISKNRKHPNPLVSHILRKFKIQA